MSDRSVAPDSPTPKLSPEERDWLRRQARSARALAAEQHRWVLRNTSERPRFSPAGRETPAKRS